MTRSCHDNSSALRDRVQLKTSRSSQQTPSISCQFHATNVFFRSAESALEGYAHVTQSRITVNNTGHVTWALPLIVKSSCNVDVTFFPFDNQQCHVRVGSAIYDERQLQLQLRTPDDVIAGAPLDFSLFTRNPEFELIDRNIRIESLTTTDFKQRYFRPEMSSTSHATTAAMHLLPLQDGAETVIYPQMVLSLKVRRKPLYYIYTIVVPTLVLCGLLTGTFLLPCDHGDKVGIGLTVFLSLYVLQLAIAENIPESNSIPLISKPPLPPIDPRHSLIYRPLLVTLCTQMTNSHSVITSTFKIFEDGRIVKSISNRTNVLTLHTLLAIITK